LVEESLAIASRQEGVPHLLRNKIVGIYFRKPSTRTRTSFTSGALKLGAQTVQYGPNDLQLVTGESFKDTGRVLSSFLNVLVVRTNDSIEEMEALAEQSEMAIINAMSDNEHPTQSIADLVTIRQALGRLKDTHVLYIGEGNNTAVALAYAIAQIPGMRLSLITPYGYGLPPDVLRKACEMAGAHGACVEQEHDLGKLPTGVDVVYTTRWLTMGVTRPNDDWIEEFLPYRVTRELMDRVSKAAGTIFMHDLPAIRGSEVVDEVLDGPSSVAFKQARHKLSGAMGILGWCAGAY
jgi:ornithine carbamoyltransferase